MRFERRGWEFKSLRVHEASLSPDPSLCSGFRLRAPASLTPAKRLKFKSLRVHQASLPPDPSLPARSTAKAPPATEESRSLRCASLRPGWQSAYSGFLTL